MDPPDGDARKRCKGTPAPPARKRRKRTPAAAAAPPSVEPPPSLLVCPGDGDAPNARRRRKRTSAAAPPYLAPRPSVHMARSDGGAPTARRRRKPTGAAAPPSLGPPPSVRSDGGAPTARRRRKPTAAAAPPSLGPPPSVRSDGGAPTARRRRKPTAAAAPPSLGPPPSVRSDGGAPTARRRRKPTAAAAPPSLGPPPSVRSDGGAPTARRRRKPTAAAAPPSLGPPPSLRTAHDDGGAPPAPPSFAPSPSVRMGPANGGAPTARRSPKPTGAAATPSRAPLPSVRMARGDGDTPPARKRKGSSRPREGKRGRRTDSEGCSSRNGSMGGHGGTESLPDDGTESSAGEGLAGSDDPNGSGAGVAANPGHGSPDDPTPPSAPHQNGIISVAHTPNIPPRFEGLVRHITSISTYAIKGSSYECGLDQMKCFLNWNKSERAFFFEWNDENLEMIWWMHNLQKGEFFKFTVNAAFSHNMDDINVQRAAVAFSTAFIGNNAEHWSGVKDMLMNMFGSFEDDGLKDYDYLYVFTRVGDSIYFRNYKIISFPKSDDSSSGLVLTEINTSFCLKPIIDQMTPKRSDIGQHHAKNETSAEQNFCPVTNISNGQTGFCLLPHGVDFNGKTYSILIENCPFVSSVEKLEGFNRSLAEIVVKEPLLKMKHIIGSVTNKTFCFARHRCKLILQSLFAEFSILFESGKCICDSMRMHNVLVRENQVKLYGLDLVDYDEKLARKNVVLLVRIVRNCFPKHQIPVDLFELLGDLEKDPLNEIRRAKDDCSLLKAAKRRNLLIEINSEYMTNVVKSSGSKAAKGRSLLIDTNSEYMTNVAKSSGSNEFIDQYTFFDLCPYADDWEEIMQDNCYMVQVCNVERSSDNEEETDFVNQKLNDSVRKIMKKQKRVSRNTESIKRMTKKKKEEDNRGRLQFSSKRNFEMHMPEKARKAGIFPFKLGLADYILTAYFPLFLRFVQKRMRDVEAEKEELKKTQQ